MLAATDVSTPTPRLVFYYRRTGKFAFHALAGALETDPRTRAADLVFADSEDAVVGAVTEGLAQGRAVITGWSFYSPDFPAVAAVMRAVRARLGAEPRVLHVAGGVHATAEPLQTLRAGFDLVALGEGETIVRDLVVAVQGGGEPRAVRGIGHDRGGELSHDGRGEVIALDDFPPFALRHGRLGPIEITRGCLYACKFCQTPFFHKARFRHRSVDGVAHYARALVERGFRDYRFLTPTSLSYGSATETPCLDAVEELLARVRGVIGRTRKLFYGTFPSEVRPEHVTPRALAILARYADNRTLILGGQSGSDRVLAASGRGHGVAEIERATALCLEAGFVPHVDFLFGMPGERDEDAAATLQLAERLAERGARVHGHTFMPLPGTPYRDAPPGRLSLAMHRALLRLASRGRLYGQWQQQGTIAREIAARRAAAGARPS